jgi:hypothetical protein
MSNAEAIEQRKNFIIRNSLFDIRYSFQAHGKFIILKLTTAEEPAKHLQFLRLLGFKISVKSASICFWTGAVWLLQ